jgi:hypothetical protein
MNIAWTALSAAATALVPVAVGIAREAQPAPTRVETLPAHETWVERSVVCRPAVLGERQVPVYETVKVPVVETRCVPVFEDVPEPVWATREVQALEERQVPVKGPVEVPVYEARRRPVAIEFTNPFTCCPVSWRLWDRCETVQVGSRTEEGIVDWRTEATPVVRTERYVAETRTRRAQVGERQETVTVGERDETRCVGWRTETYVARPEVTQVVRERVAVPAEAVTVVAAAQAEGVAPLPGTSRVLTEEAFQRALASATAPGTPALSDTGMRPPPPAPSPAMPAPTLPPTTDPAVGAPTDADDPPRPQDAPSPQPPK